MVDVTAFMLIVLCALLMFGLPLAMLNLNRVSEEAIVHRRIGWWWLDLLLMQYELLLGEFETENFAHKPEATLVFFFFILATFFSNIVMLNMLIAIMGDSF